MSVILDWKFSKYLEDGDLRCSSDIPSDTSDAKATFEAIKEGLSQAG